MSKEVLKNKEKISTEISQKVQNQVTVSENTSETPADAPVRNKYADKLNKKAHKKKHKKLTTIILIIIIIAIIVVSVFAVKSILKTDETQQLNGTTFSYRGTLETFVSGYGNVSPMDSVTLGKNVKGKVLSLNYKVGDEVNEGDVLLTTDPTETNKELNQARTDLDTSNQQVSVAQKNISGLTITAPFNGKIISLSENIKKGEQLSDGSAFATFVDDSTMNLPLYFSYGYENDLKVGMSATVSIPSSMSTVTGTISSIEKIRKISTDGTVLFKSTIKMKNPGTLTKDMIATAVIMSSNGDILPYDSGKLEYAKEEVINSKTSGEIIELNASEFYTYSSGTVLCRIENDALYDTLKQAQRSVTTNTEKIAELEKTLEQSQLRCPLTGIITSLVAKQDDELTGSDIITISNLGTLIVDAQIDEMNIAKVSVGMPVQISVEQVDGTYETQGEVISVSFTAENNDNNNGGMAKFPVKIRIDNTDNKLRPGQGVDYKISCDRAEDCIIIPTSAIVYSDEGPSVYAKPLEGQTFEKTLPILEGSLVPEGFYLIPVSIGVSDDQNTEIISGLDENVEIYLATQSEDEYGMDGEMGYVG